MNPGMFYRGEKYSHQQIINELKVGNSGGIRVAKQRTSKIRRVVLFSTAEQEANPRDNPYRDSCEDGVLTYTGTGKLGNQNLTGANQQITNQNIEFFPIYVFSLVSHRKIKESNVKRWKFSGIYKFLDFRPENQIDLLGNDRSAWIFRLLELEVNEAHPSIESHVVHVIKEAFLNPDKSAQKILNNNKSILYEDVQIAIGKMLEMNSFQFEYFVKHVLEKSDFRNVQVTRRSSDGGIDIQARMPSACWPVESQIFQVQVKRWLKPVGRREVAELRGSLTPRSTGVIISTGNYSKTAILESERPHLQPIFLVNGYQFGNVVSQLNLPM